MTETPKTPPDQGTEGGEAAPATGQEPPTLWGRVKRVWENNALAVALLVIAALVGGLAAFIKDFRELVDIFGPTPKPSMEVSAGPGLVLNYEPDQQHVTFDLPLNLRLKDTNNDLVQSVSAILDSDPPQHRIIFSESEVLCATLTDKTNLPAPIRGGQWLKLNCRLSKDLGAESVATFLGNKFFRLKVTFEARDSGVSSADTCYFLMKAAISDMRKGIDLPKRFHGSCN